MQAKNDPLLYGPLAEFDGPAELIRATEHAYEAGYRRMDAYSPYPIEELAEALEDAETIYGQVVSFLPGDVRPGDFE